MSIKILIILFFSFNFLVGQSEIFKLNEREYKKIDGKWYNYI